jgi:hypothetical protein
LIAAAARTQNARAERTQSEYGPHYHQVLNGSHDCSFFRFAVE